MNRGSLRALAGPVLFQDDNGRSTSRDALREVSRSFTDYSQKSGSSGLWVALLLGGFLLLVLLRWFLSPSRRMAERRLFLKVAEANALSRQELKLLMDIALRVHPENPLMLFFSRDTFEDAISYMGVDLAVVEGIRRKVYSP